jgi:peptide/nickel transport system ATP-binding protein
MVQAPTGERSMNDVDAADRMSPVSDAALSVRDLTCEITTPAGVIRPVDHVSFSLARGTTLGVVGESGAGKSMLARALMGIQPRGAQVTGEVFLNGVDIMTLGKKAHREMLGAGIALIFQDPMTSLNPVVPIGRQITDGMRFHQDMTRTQRRDRAVELLMQVGIPDPVKRLKQYPHQLSGGMRQRVTIAAALGCDPGVLIADEATTALDVTVQKQILDLLNQIQADRHMTLIIITHDLGIVAGRTDEIAVMYAGQIVESGTTKQIFGGHRNRYTAALLRSMPQLEHESHALLPTILGAPPRLATLPPGCRFAPRCGAATPECGATDLEFDYETPDHRYRCIHPVNDGAETHVVDHTTRGVANGSVDNSTTKRAP